MKSRWLLNLVLLVLIIGIVAFLYLRPQKGEGDTPSYEVSALKMSDFNRVTIEFPTKAPVAFEKIDGYWHLVQPYKARAEQRMVQAVLSVIAGTTIHKFPANDLARFGLDTPKLKVKLNDEEFLFGTYNTLTSEQYVAYKDAVYLLPVSYSEAAGTQVVEFLDKNPLGPKEKVAGFDLSRLEQWEDIRLVVDLVDGKWKVSAANAKPEQNEMNEWFETSWKHASVTAVEPYTPDRKATYPSLEVKLADGKKVHFDKIQESPELLLARPDEGLIYHFPQDAGFVMLNPPINLPK